MRIARIHIYGFGHLRDVVWELPDGITLVSGLNESGKTTLMAFIRGVLFGFSTRRNPEERYEPLEGGVFGGELDLLDEQKQRFRIKRVYREKVAGDVVVQLPDGGEAGEAFLQQLLGRMNANVFKNVFAFGLDELQHLGTLREAEINHFIYTAGTGDGRDVLRVQRILHEAERTYFRANSSKPKINAGLKALREAKRTLNHLRHENESYNQLTERLSDRERTLAQEEQHMETQQRELRKWELLRDHKDDCEAYFEIRDRIAALPVITHFPEDGITRLDSLNQEIQNVEADLADVQENKRQVQTQLEAISVNKALLAHEHDIATLRDHLHTYLDHQEQKKRCQLETEQEQGHLRDIKDHLGPSWTQEGIVRADTSVMTKQTVRQFASDLRDRQNDMKVAENELQTARGEVKEREQDWRDWQSRQPAKKGGFPGIPAKTDETLAQEWQALEQVKVWEQELEALDIQITGIKEKRARSSNARWKAWIMMALAILIPGILWLVAQPLAAVIALGFLGWLTYQSYARRGEEKTTTDRYDSLIRQREAIQQRMAKRIRLFHQTDIGSREWEAAWRTDHVFADEWKRWQERQDEMAQLWRQSKIRLQQKEQVWRDRCQHVRETETNWQQWLADQGWITADERSDGSRPLIAPEAVLDLLGDVEKGKAVIQRLSGIQLETERHAKFMVDYESKASDVLQDLGQSLSLNHLETQIRDLIRQWNIANEQDNRVRALSAKLAELDKDVRRHKQRLEKGRSRLVTLLKLGEAEDEETFRQRAGQYEELMKRQSDFYVLRQSLTRLAKNMGETSLDDLLDKWTQTGRAELEERVASMTEALHATRARCQKHREELADIKMKMAALASDEIFSDANQHYHQLVSQLQKDAEEWAVTAVAGYLVKRAMQTYEQERQPGVLKQASRYLDVMTEGRYRRVLAPIGEQKIEVERWDGSRFAPEFLSRGTVEQLFLAIRFALVEEYGKHVTLPVVLDDIFVNFDAKRASAAIRALGRVASHNQVLFFTCHAHLCEAFMSERIPHHTINLNKLHPDEAKKTG